MYKKIYNCFVFEQHENPMTLDLELDWSLVGMSTFKKKSFDKL